METKINTTHDHSYGLHREDLVDKHNKDCEEFKNLINKTIPHQPFLFLAENKADTRKGDGFFKGMNKTNQIQFDIQCNRDNVINGGGVILPPLQWVDKVDNKYKNIDLCIQLTSNRLWALVFFHNDLDKSLKITREVSSQVIKNRVEDFYKLKDLKYCRLYKLNDKKERLLFKESMALAIEKGVFDHRVFEAVERKYNIKTADVFYNRIRPRYSI